MLALRKAIVEFPGEAGFFNLLAIAVMGDNRDRSAAKDLLHKAIQLDPANPVYKANLRRLEGPKKKAASKPPRRKAFFGRLRSFLGMSAG